MENLATFKTTPSMYQHVTSQSSSGVAQRAFNEAANAQYAAPTTGFTLSRKGGSYQLISVRTSDKDLESYSSSVSHVAYLAPQGTGSFVQMHNDISGGLSNLVFSMTSYASRGREEDDTDTPATGELEPVGGAVLPMLLLACAYMVVRFFKNRKISKQVNSQTL